jgi:hypothetical protein
MSQHVKSRRCLEESLMILWTSVTWSQLASASIHCKSATLRRTLP